MNPNHPHALYRFFDSTGTLLYIGITWDIAARFPQHTARKPWWTAVASITIEQHPNRVAVLEAERLAIKAEKPLYNVTHADRPAPAFALDIGAIPAIPLPVDDPRWAELATGIPELNLVQRWVHNAAEDYVYLAMENDNGRLCGTELWDGTGIVAPWLLGDMSLKRLTVAIAGPDAGQKIWPDETDPGWIPPEPTPTSLLSMSWEPPRDLHRDDDDARFITRVLCDGWEPPARLMTLDAYGIVRERLRSLMPACVGCTCGDAS